MDDIDLWVGALAEDHLPGSSVGELTQTILVDQFTRLRDGDRFWYENIFSAEDVDQLQLTKLSDIIQRNTTITNLQDDVFHMTATVTGTVAAEATGKGSQGSRGQNLSGVTVELLNDEGIVVDSTITDSRGSYSFNSFLETGDYQVRVTRPTAKGTVTETADVLISVSGQVVSDVNFGSQIKDRNDRDHHERQHGGHESLPVRDRALEELSKDRMHDHVAR